MLAASARRAANAVEAARVSSLPHVLPRTARLNERVSGATVQRRSTETGDSAESRCVSNATCSSTAFWYRAGSSSPLYSLLSDRSAAASILIPNQAQAD